MQGEHKANFLITMKMLLHMKKFSDILHAHVETAKAPFILQIFQNENGSGCPEKLIKL